MGLFTSIYKRISVYTDIIQQFRGLSFALEQTNQHNLARNAGIEPAPLVSKTRMISISLIAHYWRKWTDSNPLTPFGIKQFSRLCRSPRR